MLIRIAGLALVMLVATAAATGAQSFGRNKVHYDDLDFRILETPHFDIYYYPAEHDASVEAGRLAERWYARLSKALDFEFTERQPIVLYASHSQFVQTNVIPSFLGEGIGGFTEHEKGRIVLPFAAGQSESSRSDSRYSFSAFSRRSSERVDRSVAPVVVHRRHGRIPVGRPDRFQHGHVAARCRRAAQVAADRSTEQPEVVSVPVRTGVVGVSGGSLRRRRRREVPEITRQERDRASRLGDGRRRAHNIDRWHESARYQFVAGRPVEEISPAIVTGANGGRLNIGRP